MITHPDTCPHCGETRNPWLTTMATGNLLAWDCCGVTEELAPHHYLITFGKYEGSTLEEITDEWYLGFLGGIAVEREDWVLARCLEIRKT